MRIYSKLCLIFLSLILIGAPALANETPSKILITNVHIFDGISEQRLMNANLLVEGKIIKKISKENIVAENAMHIDGKGRTLIPGLIDMHWHSAYASIPMGIGLTTDLAYHTLIAAKSNEKAILRGFTTVRDVGGNVFSLAKLTDAGVYDGPRIFPSGPAISQTSGHTDFRPGTAVPVEIDAPLIYMERIGHVMVADGVPEVLKRTREALRMGASQIKINSGGGVSSSFDPLDVTQFTIAETEAAVAAARDWHTYVATHTFTDEATQRAVNAGVISIEHGHLLTEKTLRLMKKKGAYLSMQPILDDDDAIQFPEGSFSRMKYIQVTEGTDRVYSLAKKVGVKTVFGTDTLFDPALAEKQGKQLAKLSRWYTPVEALRQATSTAGELLALSGPRNPYPDGALGVIKEGAYADLILVNGNPLEDLKLVANPEDNFDFIMKDGKIYKNKVN
ncbi:MAG: amidohydrolase family protein [Deltaproteobacteria bacterium]|nr:MAG: amidohydrolase family protein [Deltaproteobacteria bacterium]